MFPIQGSLIEACQKLLWHVQGDDSSFHADAERLKGISLYTRSTIGIIVGSYGVEWHGKLRKDETGTVERKGAAVDEMRTKGSAILVERRMETAKKKEIRTDREYDHTIARAGEGHRIRVSSCFVLFCKHPVSCSLLMPTCSFSWPT